MKSKRLLIDQILIRLQGYASAVYEMLQTLIKTSDNIELSKDFLDRFHIKLDYQSDIFQNLNGTSS